MNRKQFLDFIKKLPDKAKTNIVVFPYNNKPLSLMALEAEIKEETEFGRRIMKKLGIKVEEKSKKRIFRKDVIEGLFGK